MKLKNFSKILILFIVLFFCFSAVSASENIDDLGAMDDVVSEVDSNGESAVNNVEQIELVDNSNNILSTEEQNEDVIGESSNNILTDNRPHQIIYVNASSQYDGSEGDDEEPTYTDGQSWDKAYGLDTGYYTAFTQIQANGSIRMANGDYIFKHPYEDWGYSVDKNELSQHFCIITGYGDNVRFVFPEGYDLDFTTVYNINDGTGGTISTLKTTITHENIIFDCDVKVGGRNFKFVNCTFNKGLNLSHTYVSDDIFAMTFENCTFANSKSDIIIADKVTASFDNDCTFPVTAVDSAIDITSSEKGVVVITLTDGTAPVVGATVKYTINGGTELSNLTDGNGQIKITGLKGLVDILANFTGNGAYNANSTSKSFDFRDNTNIIISNESKVIIITLTDGTAPVVGATVKYTINGGAELSNLTDGNGQIKITEVPDEFEINATYLGDNLYNQSSNSQKFNFTKPPVNNNTGDKNNSNVKPADNNKKTDQQKTKVTKKATKITAKKATFKAKKKTKKYTITLKAGKKAIAKVKVTIKVGKKTYTAKTNAKGKATFNLKKLTKKGKYTAVIKFAGNKNYKATSTKVKITVKK